METFTITPLRWLTNFGISKLLIGFVMKEMTLFDLRLGFGIGLFKFIFYQKGLMTDISFYNLLGRWFFI